MALPLSDNWRRVLRLRESAAVERCHVVPHHGSYSVGSHSFGALSLLLVLHPSPSLDLIKAVAWHDAAERFTGDVPSTGKAASPEFRTALFMLEDRVLRQEYGMGFVLDSLSLRDHHWLCAVDLLDLLLWCCDQRAMGNTLVLDMQSRVEARLSSDWDSHPQEVKDFLQEMSERSAHEPHNPTEWRPTYRLCEQFKRED